MDAIDGFRRPCPRRSVRTALPPAASSPMSCDTGRAAAGRAGSFNSGKNISMALSRHGPARHGTARHGTASHGTTRQCMARYNPARPSIT